MHKRTLCIYEYMTLELAKFLNRTEKAPIAVEKKKKKLSTHTHTHTPSALISKVNVFIYTFISSI